VRRGAPRRAGLTLRVLGASIVLALVVGGTFAVLLRAISAEREAAALSLLSSANRLQRLVIDLETGARGYLLTGEESFLQPWAAARQTAGQETAYLQRLTPEPRQHAQAVEITQAINCFMDDYSVPLVDAARRGDLAPGASRPRLMGNDGSTRSVPLSRLWKRLSMNWR
jgi:CHASE3 domain sensor protein